MPETTTMTNREVHVKALLEAGLTTGWLRRTGPSGQPGEWSPIEFVAILDDEVEVSLYPTWSIVHDVEKGLRMWSGMFCDREGAGFHWRWRISGFSVDHLTREESKGLEDLDFQFDDRYVDYLVEDLCDSQAKPEVPDQVVKAFAALTARD